MTRVLMPCGTPGAFARHVRRGEPIDQPCRDARNALQRRWRKAREVAVRSLVARHQAEFRRLYYTALSADGDAG